MKAVAIIPARYSSTRLPGKPLVAIDGKPLIQHVYEKVCNASYITRIVVATDDRRIVDAVKRFGGEVVLTSPSHTSGTDRVAEAAQDLECDMIVNVQGDEPLIHPGVIDLAIEALRKDPKASMGTVAVRIKSVQNLLDPNVVKVVTDVEGRALYFSRSAIPFVRDSVFQELSNGHLSQYRFMKHLGIYSYWPDFLQKFTRLQPTPLEKTEKLEQLRALENGYIIAIMETEYDSVGVDTPEDLVKVREILRRERF